MLGKIICTERKENNGLGKLCKYCRLARCRATGMREELVLPSDKIPGKNCEDNPISNGKSSIKNDVHDRRTIYINTHFKHLHEMFMKFHIWTSSSYEVI